MPYVAYSVTHDSALGSFFRFFFSLFFWLKNIFLLNYSNSYKHVINNK